jgi:hypothetical protein
MSSMMQSIVNSVNSAAGFASQVIRHPLVSCGTGVILGVVLSKYLARSSAQIQHHHSNLALRQKKIQNLNKKGSEFEAADQLLQSQLLAQQKKIEDLTKEASETEAANRLLQSQLQDHQNRIQDLTAEVIGTEEANQLLQSQLQVQQETISQAEQLKNSRRVSVESLPTITDRQEEFSAKITQLSLTAMLFTELKDYNCLAVIVGKSTEDRVMPILQWSQPDEFQEGSSLGDVYLIVNGRRLVDLRYLFILVEVLPGDQHVCYCLNREGNSEVLTFQNGKGLESSLLFKDCRQGQCQEAMKALYRLAGAKHSELVPNN